MICTRLKACEQRVPEGGDGKQKCVILGKVPEAGKACACTRKGNLAKDTSEHTSGDIEQESQVKSASTAVKKSAVLFAPRSPHTKGPRHGGPTVVPRPYKSVDRRVYRSM
jgi:hypothetical protein